MQKGNMNNTGTCNGHKKGSPKFNMDIVKRLVKKYGVSARFIKMSIDGERTSETSTTIKKDYEVLHKKVKEAIK